MKIASPQLQNIFNYISKINQTAYEDEFLIVNNVLSKNPFFTNMINNYLLNKPAEKIGTFFKIKKIFLYYIKNFKWLIAFIGKKLIHSLSRQYYQFSPENRKLILIDTTIYIKRVTNKDNFEDILFPGLLKILQDQQASFCLTPVLYDSSNLAKLFRTFRFLKKNNVPVLTEFQVISKTDFFHILLFIAIYPLSLARFIKNMETSYEAQLLSNALWESFDDLVASSYMRLLFGKRICKLPAPEIQCISWYENQTRHKTFYKGLRDLPGKVRIIGAQLCIWPETRLNLHIDEEEKRFGTIPDKVLVNGNLYLPRPASPRFAVGPSMRYGKIFRTRCDPLSSQNILVVMPYEEEEQDIVFLLNLIDSLPPDTSILVKFHPSTDNKKYATRFQGKIKIAESDFYDLLIDAKLVIGRSSGTLVEAISLGIPTIVLAEKNGLSNDYIPSYTGGKGLIWDKASNITEVIRLIERFEQNLKTNSTEIESLTKKYREMFFCEPTKEKVINAFELDSGN